MGIRRELREAIRPKVYCGTCKHYDTNVPGDPSSPHSMCYESYVLKDSHSGQYKDFPYADEKNKHNDCKVYEKGMRRDTRNTLFILSGFAIIIGLVVLLRGLF